MAKKRATTTRRRKRAAKRAARGRRAPVRAAREARASRAIEVTLAELAHEIRTPLTGILALGELLTTSGLGAREHAWAAAIKSTAEHLAMLTSLVVDAARAEAAGLVLRRELVHLRRLIGALSISLGGRADAKGLKSEVAVGPGLPE